MEWVEKQIKEHPWRSAAVIFVLAVSLDRAARIPSAVDGVVNKVASALRAKPATNGTGASAGV